jgi:hypothetical protein
MRAGKNEQAAKLLFPLPGGNLLARRLLLFTLRKLFFF